MYKTLCVAALLVAVLVLAGRSSSAAPAPFTSPVIVARGKVVNQTGQLSSNTIFTPSQSGLYRLSVYATITIADPNSSSTTSYTFNWTDETGRTQSGSVLAANDNGVGQFDSQALLNLFGDTWADGGFSRTFAVKAGSPILQFAGPSAPDNSAYSLYWTLERLE